MKQISTDVLKKIHVYSESATSRFGILYALDQLLNEKEGDHECGDIEGEKMKAPMEILDGREFMGKEEGRLSVLPHSNFAYNRSPFNSSFSLFILQLVYPMMDHLRQIYFFLKTWELLYLVDSLLPKFIFS